MSTSQDIKNMTQKFVENKRQENLEGAKLEDIAEIWAASKEADNKDEQQKKISEVVNAEKLQNKIDEYMTDLQYGRFSPADFPHISEFCEEFGYKLSDENLKNKISSLKESMDTCRLNLPHDVNILFDDQQKDSYPIPHMSQVKISGNIATIKDLSDKKTIAGKTFSFSDSNENVIGGVEFDNQNDAHILYTNKDGNVIEYKLNANNGFSRVNEDKTETILDTKDAKSLSTQDIRAYNMALSAKKIWKQYINKELDKNVQKPKTVINEGGLRTAQINEGQEGDANIPQTTRFDEQSSEKKTESELNNDDANDVGTPPDELYWKEDDIIKVMFQDWFLAAANSATNWVVHQVEYVAIGVWNNLHKAYRTRDTEDKPKEDPDVTHQFFTEVEKVSQQNMEKQKEAYNDQGIIEQIKNGNIQDVLIQNDLLREFIKQTNIDAQSLLQQGSPEKTVPLLTSCASVYNKYADTYARAALLDGKMQSRNNYIGADAETFYERKKVEAGKIIKHKLYEKTKANHSKASLNDFVNVVIDATKDMDKALEFGLKDYDKKRYDENGKKPKENKILQEYQSHLAKDAPQNLLDFANDQNKSILNRDYILAGINTEQKEIEAAEKDHKLYREKILRNKDYILKGLNNKQEMTNIIPTTVPFRPPFGQGRE